MTPRRLARRAATLASRTRRFLAPPRYDGVRLTLKRLLNLYLVRYQQERGHVRLRGYPVILTVEAGNVCNLRCPACFTGAGEVGRVRSFMPLDLYRSLLAELGDYLFSIDFYNWGEPLLSKDIYTMVEEAAGRGISTGISTNFSIPFDAERAERLVRSGLHVLGVSIDGASQESYEQYRVRGDLATVLENCRLVRDAKRRLGSRTPRLVWEYHVFAHNVHEIDQARAMAAELEMEISVEKGWVVGPDWDAKSEFQYVINAAPKRCDFLWRRAVVNNDGGVAPCCGTFYQEHDFAKLAIGASELGQRSFREAWNGEKFLAARRLFRSRAGDSRDLICYDCPITVMWEKYQRHRAAGGDAADFDVGFSTNDSFNFFFGRRPAAGAHAQEESDLLDLQPVDTRPSGPA
jgi:MoaA/NifB/PqqE/SkfB family radical SAM enzyme